MCHAVIGEVTVRKITKICGHVYSLVKSRTIKAMDSLVKILRSKYKKEGSKDKQVTHENLEEKRLKTKTREETNKRIKILLLLFLLCHHISIVQETSTHGILSAFWLICSNR
jgi:hypothetical protein